MLRADGGSGFDEPGVYQWVSSASASCVWRGELASLPNDVLFAVSRAGDPLTLLRLDSLVPKKLDAPRKWLQRAKQVYEVRRRMESRELGPSLVLLETRRPPCFNPFGRTEHDERDAMR